MSRVDTKYEKKRVYKGSCLCGEVELEITGPIKSIIHCHCSKCRKNSGTAFATNGFVSKKHFCILKGQDKLSRFETSPGKKRHFCRVCGSPVYSESDSTAEYVRLRLGILDSDIEQRPQSHNFVDSKANWEDLDANLPRYSEHEPSRELFTKKE